MLKNYFVTAIRSLRRQLGYTAINVLGLGVGIACCVVIALYVWSELSYDRFHEDADRIYRIESLWGGGEFSLPATNWPFVEVLKTEYPHLTVATLLRTGGSVRFEDRMFREDHLLIADDAFFEVFSFELSKGDPATALSEPYTVVLSEELASKYFDDADPIGQRLRFFGVSDVLVTGIFADPPGPTHMPLSALLSWPTLMEVGSWENLQRWSNNSVYTYIRFPDESVAADLEAAFPSMIERHAGENWNGSVLGLQPLPDIHLYSNHSAELSAGGNPAYITVFAVVALFILLLAGVNFVNLSTARSLERAKEVGVRKSIGAGRAQLARQFLAEAVLIAGLGLIVAVALVAHTVPLLEGFVGRPLLPEGKMLALAALAATGVTVLVGLGGGLYPALALSRFKPVEVLRGRLSKGRNAGRTRQGLVILQFTVAVVLVVGTLVVYGQLQFLRNADLGFDEAQVLAVRGSGAPASTRLAFFDAMKAEVSIENVSSASEPMPAELLSGWGIILPGAVASEESEQAVSTRAVYTSVDFFGTLGVPLLAGRDFRAGSAADSAGVILNESAARQLAAQVPGRFASPGDLVGETVSANGERQILGIVPDFHMAPLHSAVEPIGFYLDHTGTTFLVRIAPGSIPAGLQALQNTWPQFFPEAPLEHHFVDEAFGAAYRAEEQFGVLAMLFSGLAIFVACLGLFGLSAYAAERRTKEIGIRKVMGATVGSVVALLSKDFAQLVLIATIIAAPIGYYAMSRWLDDFPYRMEISLWIFAVAGGLALLIALLTVSSQAFKAALKNPVESLRYE